MTASALMQILASGLLMGLIYGMVAVGLSLIFGLMDVVNFAHGEFMMLAMYATFGCFVFFHIDPVLALPLVAAVMFIFGASVYVGVVRHALRVKVNAGMVQIFATFGLATLIQGAAQFFFTPDYRNIGDNGWLGGKTLELSGLFLPLPQVFGAVVSLIAFGGLYLLMKHSDFGRALEATREDKGAVALVGIDSNRVFALGWGMGAALVGVAGAVLSTFYYIHPQVGAAFGTIAYITVALGGFGSVFGAFAAGIVVGLVEALTAVVLPPAMKSMGIYVLYLAIIFLRPQGLFGRL
ncbi:MULTISPECIES: branched-chain amino acid ABC transporter permease [Variovorax]|uniref:branched-chain amino acid ABC transporter permease n=1 Tax=Variovorax TaxID=34072 RepID=UPI00119943EA|nr:branched-chain amino acid ABC transporter permease [Variovorax paradoxus]MDR6524126.1 branched-chain amino acid transport system permease protein [Variovorax paradoxus]